MCQAHAKQSSTTQVINTSSPEQIDDGEEAERVSQMLQRESLVRGLGVVELVHRLLKSVHNNDPSAAILPVHSESAAGAVHNVVDRLPPNHVCLLISLSCYV